MTALIEVEDLTVGRAGVALLERLAFALAPGEALALRGPNGCGKTTLLRTLAGLLPPISGRLRAGEFVWAGHLDGVKAQLTVAENLQFWAAMNGGGDVAAALQQFALVPLRDRPARSLSAGQKRRLGLARLLLGGRRLWLLDEPTVSLDAASVTAFAAVVEAHLAGGGAVVVATHVALGFAARELDLTRHAAGEVIRAGADTFGAGW